MSVKKIRVNRQKHRKRVCAYIRVSTTNGSQLDSLEKLYTNRLSVLTGTAGTGKTTVISSLITGIKEKEPHHDFLLLAPTGKAALVMRDQINDPNVSVLTIHSFLMRNRWINYKNLSYYST